LLYGDGGNDRLLGGAGADTLRGWFGNDTLLGGAGNDLLAGGVDDDNLSGGAGADTLYGESGNDTLLGGAGNDSLDAYYGDDSLLGGDGNDTLKGAWGNDTLLGGNGNDSLRGGEGSDRLEGGDGADELEGETPISEGFQFAKSPSEWDTGGADTLIGGNGDDTLAGGAGRDVLTGGAGKDVFVLTHPFSNQRDFITDFHSGEDRIRLYVYPGAFSFKPEAVRNEDGSYHYSPEGKPSQFVLGTDPTDEGMLFYDRAQGQLWYDEDGPGTDSKVLIAEFALSGGTGPLLTVDDFYFRAKDTFFGEGTFTIIDNPLDPF
jgi:Ca2+-binding RTX toxin-like protein